MYSLLNDSIPSNKAVTEYVSALNKTALAYACLKKRHPYLGGIVTTKDFSVIKLCDNGIVLKDCIYKIENRAIRSMIFSWLINYPVGAYLDESINEEEVIEQSYIVNVGGENADATNLAIAKYNGAFLFTISVDDSLRRNKLQLIGKSKNIDITNLYSNANENINFIETFINNTEQSALSVCKQINNLLNGKVKRTTSYSSDFNKLGLAYQKAILDRLKQAQEKGLLDFTVDNDIFKQIKGHDKKESYYGAVYELRIREPKEIRIYFQYVDNTYYVLSMGQKGTNQDLDINKAFDKIIHIRDIKK